jgi:putative membrane protein
MHNVNTEAFEQSFAEAEQDPGAFKQHLSFDGEWQTQEGQPQFRFTIPVPDDEAFVFEADFAPDGWGRLSAEPPCPLLLGRAGPLRDDYAQEAGPPRRALGNPSRRVSVLLPLIGQGGFGDGHMGGWGWLVIVAMMGGMGWMMSMMRRAGSNKCGSSEDSLEILKARYARGELTTEEFHERLRTIEDAQP